MKKVRIMKAGLFVLSFIGLMLYFEIEGERQTFFVGGVLFGTLMTWTFTASRLTGKPAQHPINLFGMVVLSGVVTWGGLIISEMIGLENSTSQLEMEGEGSTLGPVVSDPIESDSAVRPGLVADVPCCGGHSQDDRTEIRHALTEGFEHRAGLSDELRELVPSQDAVEQAVTVLRTEEEGTEDSIETELDWDDIRLGILENLEGIEQAGVAEMMLEADQFLSSMNESDAMHIRSRVDRIWERTIQRHPEFPTAGPEAAMFRKLFEMQAALERSEFRRHEEDYQANRELLMELVPQESVQQKLEDFQEFRASHMKSGE